MFYGFFTFIQKRWIYWPPRASNRSKIIELPSGKRFFVFLSKRDADGKLEPTLVFTDKLGNKLATLNTEEVYQLMQLIPRLESYFKLYEEQGAMTD